MRQTEVGITKHKKRKEKRETSTKYKTQIKGEMCNDSQFKTVLIIGLFRRGK
jgi:hypothetical protein